MDNSTRQLYLFLAWLISLIAMILSLYSTYVLNISPCPLCWFQRVCLYPLVIILGIAAFKDDSFIVPYIVALPVIGFLFALYQYLEQMIPGFAPIQLCRANGVPCSTIHFQWLGFITYPFLSMLACLLITLFLALSYRKRD